MTIWLEKMNKLRQTRHKGQNSVVVSIQLGWTGQYTKVYSTISSFFQYTVCKLYIQCSLYVIRCTLYIVLFTLYFVHCTVHFTLYFVQCTVHFTLYFVQCTVHCTLYTGFKCAYLKNVVNCFLISNPIKLYSYYPYEHIFKYQNIDTVL